MNKDILRQLINIIALLATLAVNFLANALPLNGQTSAEIANRLPIFFVPANYVFSIWGIIYTFLIGFGIYQALPSQRENPLIRRIGYWFALTCAMNAGWLFMFHYNLFGFSMIAMVILLAALIVIYLHIGIGRKAVSSRDKWLVHVPFSIYLGWITVATVANAAYVLYDAQWDGLGIGGDVWAAVMLVVAAVITLGIIIRHSDIAYTLVILWALAGIVIKQAETPLVAGTAGLMALIVFGALVAKHISHNTRLPEQNNIATSQA